MKFDRATQILSFKLTTLETFVLGALLAAAAAVQIHLKMSTQTHAAIAMAIVMIGGVVHPLTAKQFLSKIPVQVIAIVDAGLGALLIFTTQFHIGSFAQTAIAVVIVVATTWGFGPSPAPPLVPAGKSAGKR